MRKLHRTLYCIEWPWPRFTNPVRAVRRLDRTQPYGKTNMNNAEQNEARKVHEEPTFGKYTDPQAQIAKLGIFFAIRGVIASRPCILPWSYSEKPPKVWTELMDSGADMAQFISKDAFAQKLKGAHQKEGIYTSKLGWVDGSFVSLAELKNGQKEVIVNPDLLEVAAGHFGCAGTLDEYRVQVLRRALKSRYAALALLMALGAALQLHLSDQGEGVIVNLAGESSTGKTTVLRVGKSVYGPGSHLLSWDSTPRAFVEAAAALSDVFMPIDDLDKKSSETGFGRKFGVLTHMLTTGASKAYSTSVREILPDYRWSCTAMTGCRTTVDNMAGFSREKNERVRCLDIEVPAPAAGGIWDLRDPHDNPQHLTDELKAAALTYYGTLMPAWLAIIQQDGMLKRLRKLHDEWVDSSGVDQTDGIGHRVAKKFGIWRAAGLVAVRKRLLPWTEEFVEDVINVMYANARRTLYSRELLVFDGLNKALAAGKLDRKTKVPVGQTPIVPQAEVKRSFIEADKPKTWNVSLPRFNSFFGDSETARDALRKLEEIGIVTKGTDGKTTRQVRVVIDGEPRRTRFLKINGPKLQALVRKGA